MCPTDPEDWKKIEERFRNRWNVSHVVGALDGQPIAVKKPKKSGSVYFNYKGYVLLALVDADVTVTGKHGSNYRLSLSCNRKSKKLNLTNLFNSQ